MTMQDEPRGGFEPDLPGPWVTVCPWCQVMQIAVAAPESHGICETCLDREYPEARSFAAGVCVTLCIVSAFVLVGLALAAWVIGATR